MMVGNRRYGEVGVPLLSEFRNYAQSFTQSFSLAKDRVRNLLGNRYQYHSGIFREGLLKDFFRTFLPRALSVDTGFIYGFDAVQTSAQLDIVVWDSQRHSAIFTSSDFVIVPPESVVAVISVKSNLANRDLEDGLANLLSVSPIELSICNRQLTIDGHTKPIPAIAKILLGYTAPRATGDALKCLQTSFSEHIATNAILDNALREWVQGGYHFQISEAGQALVERIVPLQIAAIEEPYFSCRTGYGPPGEVVRENPPPRIAYLYKQGYELTKPFEKVVFTLLNASYHYLGTPGWSSSAAWADVDPGTGVRKGDVHEIVENSGLPWVRG
jgi:hypothetical protein